MTSTFSSWRAQTLNLWQQRSARERLLLSAGAALMALILVWRVGLAPALRTWQEAPIKQAQLDKQTQHMQELQIQSQRLQQAQAISRNDAMQWLETHLSELGPNAKLSLQGEHMSLSLQAAPADHLANWLALAREQAHVRPAQAQLQQAGTPPAATSADNTVVWNGNLLLRLP